MAALLAGCWQKSVNPFYAPKDVIAEPKLVGTWTEEKDGPDEDKLIWTFNDAAGKRLDLVMRSGKEKYDYDAYVFKLDDVRYLDVSPTNRATSMIPAHHLFKILESGDKLKVAPLNTGFVRQWLKDNPNSLAHVIIPNPEHRDDRESDDYVLTADTKALQSFLRTHQKNAELFADPTTFKR
jgi:hypothetical protein